MTTMIVGATSAIGREIARLCADERDAVILAGRDARELERVAADLRVRYQVTASVVHFDSDDAELDESLRAAIRAADRMFVAAGLLGTEARARNDEQHAREIDRANHSGLLPVIDYAAESFATRGGGAIVLLSSVAGDRLRGSNRTYGAAKAALNRHAEQLRNRYHESGVRVVIAKLGPVDTAMTFGLARMPFMISARQAAAGVVKLANSDQLEDYIPAIWQPIMMVIKRVPQSVADRL